ncbi:MAG: hypothetical protein HS101_18925 [Planctomycetia bacterium]|nr:hypothetical protein [Planctomycetia bacterium]MCC7315551.1 hypothetical protein [Planctomycetota bacterium]OQZ05275.1 MAG: hypothetical protein B6D36_11025 [Planctomycetes bacterium UTPLA1]
MFTRHYYVDVAQLLACLFFGIMSTVFWNGLFREDRTGWEVARFSTCLLIFAFSAFSFLKTWFRDSIPEDKDSNDNPN